MIPDNVRVEILHRMHKAEKEHGVRILLAVESGSRAWGFESPNSDFDARFIYVHPRDWYLSVGLEEQRDVIEYPIVDDIDLNGWDLRKALRLFWKSQPRFRRMDSITHYLHTKRQFCRTSSQPATQRLLLRKRCSPLPKHG